MNASASILILLVEDNEGDIELTQIAFARAGVNARFTIAHNGAEAVEYILKQGKFKESPVPDLILLDINMPRMGGLECLRIIKQDESAKIIPVIMLTSSNAQNDILGLYQAHANSYVLKPHGIKANIDMAKQIEQFWINLARLPSLIETE